MPPAPPPTRTATSSFGDDPLVSLPFSALCFLFSVSCFRFFLCFSFFFLLVVLGVALTVHTYAVRDAAESADLVEADIKEDVEDQSNLLELYQRVQDLVDEMRSESVQTNGIFKKSKGGKGGKKAKKPKKDKKKKAKPVKPNKSAKKDPAAAHAQMANHANKLDPAKYTAGKAITNAADQNNRLGLIGNGGGGGAGF